MSSFIVKNKTINTFLSFLNNNLSDEENTLIGRNLLKMNIEATEQRYSEPYLNAKEKRQELKNFKFEFVSTTKIQALKSLSCFLYQCSEGNIPSKKLFKDFRKKEIDLAFEIIDELRVYKEAEWG
jgi:hypothetical protein